MGADLPNQLDFRCDKSSQRLFEDFTQLLDEYVANGALIVRGWRSNHELAQEIARTIESNRCVAIIPSKRALRGFFNGAGFMAAMNEIVRQLENIEVVVPPDLHGNRYAMVIRQVGRPSREIA